MVGLTLEDVVESDEVIAAEVVLGVVEVGDTAEDAVKGGIGVVPGVVKVGSMAEDRAERATGEVVSGVVRVGDMTEDGAEGAPGEIVVSDVV